MNKYHSIFYINSVFQAHWHAANGSEARLHPSLNNGFFRPADQGSFHAVDCSQVR